MDYDNNVRDYIDDYAEEYYAGLKSLCDWNARYWEQLALLKLDRFYSSPDDSLLLEGEHTACALGYFGRSASFLSVYTG